MASKSMHYKPYPARLAVLGFLMLGLVWFSASFAMGKKQIKQLASHAPGIAGVSYYRFGNRYGTFSYSGSAPYFRPSEPPVPIRVFKQGPISIVLSADPNSVEATKAIANQLSLYPRLPAALAKALSWLGIAPFPLTIERVLVSGRSVQYKSPLKKANPPIHLLFYKVVSKSTAPRYAEIAEPEDVQVFSHELFHFLSGYEKFPRMNELREETYASLFENCVAYPLIGHVESFHSNLRYGPDAFANPHKDLKKLRKQLKKARMNGFPLVNSAKAGMISKYYFQAVANDRVGDKIQSDRIPAFCEKLFSEHNFRWPIEKKPPPWFAEFIHSTQ